MKNKILITGGSGFLGSHLVDLLLEREYKVTNIDNNSYNLKHKNYTYINSSKLNSQKLKNIVQSSHTIFHFAAQSDIEESLKNPGETLLNNINSTINILDVIAKSKKKINFIFASTLYVMGNKGSFYKTSKQCCEKILSEYGKNFNFDYSILRFGTIYGPRSGKLNSVYNILSQSLNKREVKINGNGDEVREFIHVKDAAKACLKIVEKKIFNKIIMITNNQKIKLKDLSNIINEMFNFEKKFKFLGSKKSHYKFTPYNVDQDNVVLKINLDQFRGLEEGLIETINAIKKNNLS